MRLHDLIQSFDSRDLFLACPPDDTPSEYAQQYESNHLPEIYKSLNSSVHFLIYTDSDALDFKLEEWNEDIVTKLPFPITSVEVPLKNLKEKYILLCESCESFELNQIKNKIPFYTVRLFSKGLIHPRGGWADHLIYGAVYKDLKLDKLCIGFFACSPININNPFYNLEKATLLNYIQLIYYFLTALACKNIIIKNNPAPLKLNKKRVKKGKVPVREYKTLHIEDIRIKYEENNNGKSGRASPRIHFRRGHIRKLSSGELIWVQHCLVGTNKKGMIDKEYSLNL